LPGIWLSPRNDSPGRLPFAENADEAVQVKQCIFAGEANPCRLHTQIAPANETGVTAAIDRVSHAVVVAQLRIFRKLRACVRKGGRQAPLGSRLFVHDKRVMGLLLF
jgi:hypothetical protein